MTTTTKNYQGGKAYGQLVSKREAALDEINKEVIENPDYSEVEELPEKLTAFKAKFLEFEHDQNGNIDLMGLKRMLEKLGQAKTHLEIKKMIAEVDTTNTGTISYRDFIRMMLGGKSVLKLILIFEEKAKPQERPKGKPPKQDISNLP
uniref:Allograft inflammatory factor-1 n=1 Tax=Sinohyriopsis cumingii TaxID=165450 RepID=A0A1I9RHH4_SINCU|nr:allograft inflammatory factor-1 [Sinohyriopsis cumingii]